MKLDERGLYTIYNVWHVPFWKTPWFYGICIGILVITIFLLLYAAVRLYTVYALKKRMTPWNRALDKLTALYAVPATTVDYQKYVYTEIIGILKEYIWQRYKLPVLSKTDKEMLSLLNDHTAHCAAEFSDIITMGSAVRFAGVQVAHQTCLNAINQAVIIIQKTIPQE